MKDITAQQRLTSIDILRGAIMILMAIDHVRVYSGMPAGGTTPGIFFTRWITHFCAPGFVFLAGTSAFLYFYKMKSKSILSKFLLTRGLLLVVLELTLIRFCWTFNLDYSSFVLAGVIWMIGWCMVLLAAFVWLRPSFTGIIGVLIIVSQKLFEYVPQVLPGGLSASFSKFWEFIYPAGTEVEGITILYVIVPWIGIMMAGFGFGQLLLLPPDKRNRLCRWLGLSMIAAFLIAGSIIISNRPSSPDSMPFIFQLLNQRKYPASVLYILMTLGPLIALIPFAEKSRGWFANVLTIFGRVPFFYYLLHIPLIHFSAFAVNFIRDGNVHADWYATAPYSFFPPEHQWGLPLLYLVFLVDVVVLYFLCRWYMNYKFTHPENELLKYI